VIATHKVVKFIVNVKLMEKSVNSHVGMVMVVKVTTHNKKPGMMLRRNIITPRNLPNRPFVRCSSCPSSDAWVRMELVCSMDATRLRDVEAATEAGTSCVAILDM
jgi:hypothetical protein